jgi:CheY-like chemotaxis protein/HPt (histidine-containing phosphotransfer) domain-containing protein
LLTPEPFALVLLDLNMPGMDGLQTAACIRQRAELADLVVMILSSSGEATDPGLCERLAIASYLVKPVASSDLRASIVAALRPRGLDGSSNGERGVEAGMDGDVSKPIDRRELLSLVEPGQARAAAAGGSPAKEAPVPVEGNGSRPFSGDAMLARLGGDESLARELAGLFVSECPRMMSAVRDSVASGDAEAVRKAAHALKGSIANFTEGAAMQAAFLLEQIGREGRPQDAAAALAMLEREVEELVRYLRDFSAGAWPCAS